MRRPQKQDALFTLPPWWTVLPTVTYDGLLQENLLENTLLLDTLTLEDLKKALEKAGKSVQGEPSLSEYDPLSHCPSLCLPQTDQSVLSADKR